MSPSQDHSQITPSTQSTLLRARTAADNAPADPFVVALERLAELHDQTEWAFRSIAEQFTRRDAESAELRDEVLALAHRIESVFRALESQRAAGAETAALRPLATLPVPALIAAWNDCADHDHASPLLARELTLRGYATHAADGTALHIATRTVPEYLCMTCGHASAGSFGAADHERETDHMSEPTGRRVPDPSEPHERGAF